MRTPCLKKIFVDKKLGYRVDMAHEEARFADRSKGLRVVAHEDADEKEHGRVRYLGG
jgi:hypothetical protein